MAKAAVYTHTYVTGSIFAGTKAVALLLYCAVTI